MFGLMICSLPGKKMFPAQGIFVACPVRKKFKTMRAPNALSDAPMMFHLI
jgi:hypothetical protein